MDGVEPDESVSHEGIGGGDGSAAAGSDEQSDGRQAESDNQANLGDF
jgi:hypothetical protein